MTFTFDARACQRRTYNTFKKLHRRKITAQFFKSNQIQYYFVFCSYLKIITKGCQKMPPCSDARTNNSGANKTFLKNDDVKKTDRPGQNGTYGHLSCGAHFKATHKIKTLEIFFFHHSTYPYVAPCTV